MYYMYLVFGHCQELKVNRFKIFCHGKKCKGEGGWYNGVGRK